MRALALIVLAGCALPSEVGVGLNGGEYDYLGAGSPPYVVGNQRGQEFGATVWAMWKVGPEHLVVDNLFSAHDLALELGVTVRPEAAKAGDTIVQLPDAPKEETAADKVAKIAKATSGMTGGELAFWSFLAVMVLIVALAIGPKVLNIYFAKKEPKP